MEDRGTFIIDEACLNNGKARPQNWGLNLQFWCSTNDICNGEKGMRNVSFVY